MRTKKEMFLYFLNDMYSIEAATLGLTKDMANKAMSLQEERDLEEHAEETRRQMKRLRSIIRRYGGTVATTKAITFSFLSVGTNVFRWAQTDRTQEELRMLYDAMMIDNMEIGAYKALITMAKSLGDEATTSELLISLEEEIAMSEKTEKQLSKVLEQTAKAG